MRNLCSTPETVMGKKYTADDFKTDEKPRITQGAWRFSDRVYAFRCQGRASLGYGTTPKDAFNAWRRNLRRRERVYVGREERSATVRKTGARA